MRVPLLTRGSLTQVRCVYLSQDQNINRFQLNNRYELFSGPHIKRLIEKRFSKLSGRESPKKIALKRGVYLSRDLHSSTHPRRTV